MLYFKKKIVHKVPPGGGKTRSSSRPICALLLCPFLFCNNLDGEERAGCFALFVFLVSRDCCVARPHDAMGLYAVCDCGIF